MPVPSAWGGIVLSVSANSMEVAVVGAENPDQTSWAHWTQEDDGRAELPLEGSSERFPVGAALCLNASKRLPAGEGTDQLLPAFPMLMLLSDDGLLVPFYVVNKMQNAAEVIATDYKLCESFIQLSRFR